MEGDRAAMAPSEAAQARRHVSPQVLLFLLASGIAAAANFFSRLLLSQWLTYSVAIVLAYLVGLTAAFVLNRRFVFKHSTNRVGVQMFWFVVVNIFALAQTLLVSLLFADILLPRFGIHDHSETIAHAIGIAAPTITSFFGHKYLSFKNAEAP